MSGKLNEGPLSSSADSSSPACALVSSLQQSEPQQQTRAQQSFSLRLKQQQTVQIWRFSPAWAAALPARPQPAAREQLCAFSKL